MRTPPPLPLSLKVWVMAQALAGVLGVRVALWLLPYRTVRKWAQRAGHAEQSPDKSAIPASASGETPGGETHSFGNMARRAEPIAVNDGRNENRVTARHIAKGIYLAGQLLPKGNCLPEALAACRLLGRYGHPAQLHIGVRKDGAGKLLAHAWVSSGSQVIIGGAQSAHEYQQMVRLNAGAGSSAA